MRFEIIYFFLELGLSILTRASIFTRHTPASNILVKGDINSIALIPEDKGVELLKFGHKLSHWPKERL